MKTVVPLLHIKYNGIGTCVNTPKCSLIRTRTKQDTIAIAVLTTFVETKMLHILCGYDLDLGY